MLIHQYRRYFHLVEQQVYMHMDQLNVETVKPVVVFLYSCNLPMQVLPLASRVYPGSQTQ